MSPNLPGRYVHSQMKGEPERATSAVPVVIEAREPCLAGCGELVGAGMKCQSCATAAVIAWRTARDANPHEARTRAHTEAVGRRLAQRAAGAVPPVARTQ